MVFFYTGVDRSRRNIHVSQLGTKRGYIISKYYSVLAFLKLFWCKVWICRKPPNVGAFLDLINKTNGWLWFCTIFCTKQPLPAIRLVNTTNEKTVRFYQIFRIGETFKHFTESATYKKNFQSIVSTCLRCLIHVSFLERDINCCNEILV